MEVEVEPEEVPQKVVTSSVQLTIRAIVRWVPACLPVMQLLLVSCTCTRGPVCGDHAKFLR